MKRRMAACRPCARGAVRRAGLRTAFTLVEVLCTLVIVSIMLGAVYTVFLGTLSSKRYCDEIRDAGQKGQAILLLVQRDLMGAVELPSGRPSVEGVDSSEDGAEADRIVFVSTSDTRMGREKRDLCEVGYSAEPGMEEGGSLRLVRREDPGIDDDPFSGGNEEVIEDGLKSFNLEYMDRGGAWMDEWTGEGLPAAVKVTVVLARKPSEGGAEAREYSFSAVVPVRSPSG